MKKVAIVTVDFNSEKETHDCLASIEKLDTDGITLEVIVIDNASKKSFVPTKKEKKGYIHFIRNEMNLGFSGGYNTGIHYALNLGSDYILLLNNDTIVEKAFLQELLKVIESDKKIGLVGPKIYFAKGHEFHKDRYKKEDLGNVIWYAGGGIDWKNVLSYHRGVDEVDNGQYAKVEETGFVTGCCMLFKREVFEKVGLLDDTYFLYFEDADINMRVKKNGYKIMFAPKAIVWHVNAASSGVGSSLHDYFISRNRMIFGMRYASLRIKLSLIKESLRLLMKGREWQKKGIRDFYLMRFGRGTYRF